MDRQRSLSDGVAGRDRVAPCACQTGTTAQARGLVPQCKSVTVTRSRIWMKLSSNPFVVSFVEELHPGTSKRTRENTRRNKNVSSTFCEKCEKHRIAEALTSSSSVSIPSVTQKRVAFDETVKVYSHKHESAVEHSIRFTPRRVSLARRMERSRSSAVDASTPQSTAGKWLFRYNGST
eukprot:gb/GEZJ01004008.1/.p2 GENE.gb/GEZJ01004008.1/~~gb/GEZJ01004008.1/.p2  ORF type:complete len:178 (-),score=15.71 gb/GEZJ01004008.1/:388-921(-)